MLVFEERFEGAGVKNYASRNRYMREAERAYDAAQSAPASPKPSPPMNFPPMGRGIGSFDVNALGAAPPLGSSTVNNGSTVTMNHNTTVKIDAGGDPATAGAQTERAVGRANDLSLRNVQTAIR
ncbi:hypothetical protein [Methylobacterium sp. Leaf94]|uniref:hypothetical protein n=1 Tax=Methylobacterium sp. Leaf94 TaxID=1736250 RepID=UPI000A73804F|nr:hypothetical protein [Methylobacterium sp. Leaf94]